MTNKKILKIENIEKKYIKDKNRINVLNKLSIDFEIGKLYAIVGKSCSGKSTLLKCIAALTSLDKGNIKYLDNNGNVQIIDSIAIDSKEINIRNNAYNRALRYIMDNQDFTISVEDEDIDLGSKKITIRGV